MNKPQRGQLSLDIKLREDATFENFVGDAALQLQLHEAWTYLWGGAGSGRSHLLQALCHRTVGGIYLSDLKRHSVDLLQGLAMVPLVCIDDVEDILGDPKWEAGLFHLMNEIKDAGNRLVVSGPQPALRLPIQLADLRSRLVSAYAVETCELSDDEKLKVLVQKAHQRGFRISEEVGRFILSRASRDLSEILGLLEKLEKETLRQGKTVTIPFVKSTLNL
jgi:DnaA family protein